MPSDRSDAPVSSSRREALFAVGLWFAAATYTVAYCAAFGYERAADELTFVLGVPEWVFWGIVAPWSLCTLASIWFAMRFMRDDPLGEEAAADPVDADEAAAAIESCPSREARDA